MRLNPQAGGRVAKRRGRVLPFAAASFSLTCSLLAPSDEELRGGALGVDPRAGAGGRAPLEAGAGGTAAAVDVSTGGTAAAVDVSTGGTAPVDVSTGGAPTFDAGVAGAALDAGESQPPVEDCGVPVDCAVSACDGVACGDSGRLCIEGDCSCPGGDAPEVDCANAVDDDCDGLDDCLDPDCDQAACGAETRRCCAGRCADTSQDEEHCQGCDLRCAPGQLCVRIEDESGVRGHCSCDATSECPNNPAQICRQMNGDGQDGLCACDVLSTGNAGCAIGQVCQDVPLANFCRYPTP